MLYFPKTFPGPQLELAAERVKPSGTYRIQSVLELLQKDFCNKCYLCEDSPQSINVEHLIAHQNNKDLEFSWANLFWSCSHCNNIKGHGYSGILDCSTDVDIEKKLSYEFSPFPVESVTIKNIDGAANSEITSKLLGDIYNGTTIMKKMESNELRKKMCRQINDLVDLVLQFHDAQYDQLARLDLGEKIKKNIRVSAPFASFSRTYLRRFPSTLEKLEAEIPDFPIL
jgi:uncharacterized protein (TIGR02646 family)